MKHLKFSKNFKLEAIEKYKLTNNYQATAKEFKIDRKCLREWVANEKVIRALDEGAFRCPGGGRNIASETLEAILDEMIIDQRLQKHKVTRSQIVQWALRLAEEEGLKGFSASKGWLDKFMRRHKYTLRTANRISTITDAEMVTKAHAFIAHVKQLIADFMIPLNRIYNLDETAIFVEDDSQKTIEKIGAHKVAVKSANLSRFRITGICCASAAGEKLKPTVIVKGKAETICSKDGVIYLTSAKSWINSGLFKMWIDYVFPILTTASNSILLVFDSARSHISKDMKAHLHRRKILYCIVPGGLTSMLQPADTFWFKRLKQDFREFAELWMKSPIIPKTSGGKIKPPTNELISKWFLDSWNNIDSEYIKRSFQVSFLGEEDALMISKDPILGSIFNKVSVDLKHLDSAVNLIENEDSDFSYILDE